MESAQVIRRLSLGAVALALIAGACAVGGSTVAAPVEPVGAPVGIAAVTPTTVLAPVSDLAEVAIADFVLPDVTARPLTPADLAAMLPAGEITPVPNEDLIVRTTGDADDAAADVLTFGREYGVASTVPGDGGSTHFWIDVLADADAAHRYLLDTAGDIVKRVGGTYAPEVGAAASHEFPVAVGEEAIGLVIELDGRPEHETAVLFRLGRLVLYAGQTHTAGTDLRVTVQYLAEQLRDDAVAALAAAPVVTTEAGLPPYRFETTLTVEASDGPWLLERSGVVSGADLACRVRMVGPAGETTRVVREVDGAITVSDDGRSFHPAGAGDLEVRTLVAGCRSWPLDLTASGLEPSATGSSTRHRVNGVNALGYTPDPATLGAVLGSSPEGITIESFSFWVAEDRAWVVEVGFIASGDAAIIAPALPGEWHSLGTIRLAMRHRVFDIGMVDADVETASLTGPLAP